MDEHGSTIHWKKSRLRAFTLIELMIVISILAILAALVIPSMAGASDQARIETMATNVEAVRTQIVMHASSSSYPSSVDASWFKNSKLPRHAWTGEELVVEAVSLGADVIYPETKTYDPSVGGAANAWYNSTNGNFCARVVTQKTDADTLRVFNDANKTSATALTQTQR
ncbi:MAG TPA: type II secretion system protein [Phycisphaerales bacterium]|nr:type II secretion system protein [Phycisphaerales bacterium]